MMLRVKSEAELLADRRIELYRKRWAGSISSDEQDELDALCDALRRMSMTAHARRISGPALVGAHPADAFMSIFGMTRVGDS
jgi:hypothetical protein